MSSSACNYNPSATVNALSAADSSDPCLVASGCDSCNTGGMVDTDNGATDTFGDDCAAYAK